MIKHYIIQNPENLPEWPQVQSEESKSSWVNGVDGWKFISTDVDLGPTGFIESDIEAFKKSNLFHSGDPNTHIWMIYAWMHYDVRESYPDPTVPPFGIHNYNNAIEPDIAYNYERDQKNTITAKVFHKDLTITVDPITKIRTESYTIPVIRHDFENVFGADNYLLTRATTRKFANIQGDFPEEGWVTSKAEDSKVAQEKAEQIGVDRRQYTWEKQIRSIVVGTIIFDTTLYADVFTVPTAQQVALPAEAYLGDILRNLYVILNDTESLVLAIQGMSTETFPFLGLVVPDAITPNPAGFTVQEMIIYILGATQLD